MKSKINKIAFMLLATILFLSSLFMKINVEAQTTVDVTEIMSNVGLDREELTTFLEHSIWKDGYLTLVRLPFSLSQDVRELLEKRRSFLEELDMEVESAEFVLDDIKARVLSESSVLLDVTTTEHVKYQGLDDYSVSKPVYCLVFDMQGEVLTLVNIYSLEPSFMQFLRQDMVEKIQAATDDPIPYLFTDLYDNNPLITVDGKQALELNPAGNLFVRFEFPEGADIERILEKKMTITLSLEE